MVKTFLLVHKPNDSRATGCKWSNKMTFIDNFLLRVFVPGYNLKDGKNIFVGSQNRMIRELLDAHGLTKCVVKAIVFAPCHNPSSDMIGRMPQRDIQKTANTYYYQEYKVACPNIEYETVMKFIRESHYNRVGFHLRREIFQTFSQNMLPLLKQIFISGKCQDGTPNQVNEI